MTLALFMVPKESANPLLCSQLQVCSPPARYFAAVARVGLQINVLPVYLAIRDAVRSARADAGCVGDD